MNTAKEVPAEQTKIPPAEVVDTPKVFVGAAVSASGEAVPVELLAKLANRHGIITGATGTGKTVTLQVLAEGFSALGVPVFTADVKGDLAGLSQAGVASEGVSKRLEKIGRSDFSYKSIPTLFWDLYGEGGHPVRTTIADMGPLLLAHALDLNETQEGVLHVAFRVAEDEKMPLLDLKDLRSLLDWSAEHRNEISSKYGNVSTASVAAIQRRLLVLEDAGGDVFFGEPAIKTSHFFRQSESGAGVVNILDAKKLLHDQRLYSTFLLWLLSDLFKTLPEVGDADRPKLVFFFDEAHLLFENASKGLLDKIEQVVRLIRSKGVGVYFVTQHPSDVPDSVLSQLGNRFQHALRAYTPKERKAIKAAAAAFRENPEINSEEAIEDLGTGEALVSVLDKKGSPQMVQRVLVSPPESRMGPITEDERITKLKMSPFAGIYDEAVDRESAHEILAKRREEEAKLVEQSKEDEPQTKSSRRQGPVEAFVKSLLRSIASSVGRDIAKNLLKSFRK